MKKTDEVQDPKLCASCGSVLPVEVFSKICPACLLENASVFMDSAMRVKPGDFVPPAPQDLELIFPEFTFSRLLGRGGMGAVYQAYQMDLEREVAVKILPPETAGDPEFRERFRREAATLAQLDHPNIVGLFDFGEREGYFYFVMEYIEGADLSVRMTGQELTTSEVLNVVSQVCDALDYSHERGVVHRDIKPANILIDKAGRVKIVDFGLAKVVRGDEIDPGLTRTQSMMGTPQYMAPEQMAGSKETDHRSDIYALGVVLYELLTGKVPAGHFKSPSAQKPTLNPRLDEVVLRALKNEPDQRFQKASDIKSGLHEAISKPEPSPKEKARTLTIRILAAATVAAILGWAGVWWTSQEKQPEISAEYEVRKIYEVVRIGADGKTLPIIPITSGGLADVSLSGSRESFGVGINAQGKVVAWGSNRYGQASPPPGLQAVTVVAGQGQRNAHVLALKKNGTVVGWGDDTFGQATPPKGLQNVTAIAAGETFSIALQKDGSVTSWGSLSVEAQGAKTIAAGAKFAAILLENGTIKTFGDAPQMTAKGKAIAVGESHLLVLDQDGTVSGWGANIPENLPSAQKVFAGAQRSAILDTKGHIHLWPNAKQTILETAHHCALGRNELIYLR